MTFNGYFRITTTKDIAKFHEELKKNEDVPYLTEVGGGLEGMYCTWFTVIDEVMKVLYKNNWTIEDGWTVVVERSKRGIDSVGDWTATLFIEEGKPHCQIREAVETIKWVNKGDILENIEM